MACSTWNKAGPGHTVKVWDARTRDPVGEIGRHDHQIWGMKFSPDGRRLATASVDGTVRVWAWDPARIGEMQKPELTLSVRVIGVRRPRGVQPGMSAFGHRGRGAHDQGLGCKDGQATPNPSRAHRRRLRTGLRPPRQVARLGGRGHDRKTLGTDLLALGAAAHAAQSHRFRDEPGVQPRRRSPGFGKSRSDPEGLGHDAAC